VKIGELQFNYGRRKMPFHHLRNWASGKSDGFRGKACSACGKNPGSLAIELFVTAAHNLKLSSYSKPFFQNLNWHYFRMATVY
jgi:hypothetical protein